MTIDVLVMVVFDVCSVREAGGLQVSGGEFSRKASSNKTRETRQVSSSFEHSASLKENLHGEEL